MGFQQGGDAPGREVVFPLTLKNCEQVGVIEFWGAHATTHGALCFISLLRVGKWCRTGALFTASEN